MRRDRIFRVFERKKGNVDKTKCCCQLSQFLFLYNLTNNLHNQDSSLPLNKEITSTFTGKLHITMVRWPYPNSSAKVDLFRTGSNACPKTRQRSICQSRRRKARKACNQEARH